MPHRTSIVCPVCETSADAIRRGTVEYDRCATCGGVWLDCGELEVLLAMAHRSGKLRAAAPPAGSAGSSR